MTNKVVWYGGEEGRITDANEVPRADRIRGAEVYQAQDGEPLGVVIHWNSPDGPQKLSMRFPDALFLLSVLKSVQLDLGIPFPDDPRDGTEARTIQ